MTGIADHAKIDFDQAFIESMSDAGRLSDALQMYENGGFSQSIARLHLVSPDPPSMAIPEGTKVVGRTSEGLEIKGTLLETAIWYADTDEVVLLVEYEATMEQTSYCHVGGLTVTNSHETDGCFSSDGTIKILDFQEGAPVYEYTYTYEPVEDTYNGRTFQSLSTRMEMTDSKHQAKFIEYYGSQYYADQWIQAAVNGTRTDFLQGNADFSAYDATTRKDVMLAAPKVLNLWMYVVQMMEYAVIRCNFPCGQESGDRCDDIPVRAWDQSVGFYSGSLEGPDGAGEGVLLYDLADTMCEKFKTCSVRGDHDQGTSSVNFRIIDLFGEGQLALLRRECVKANDIKDQIVKLMTIPLIQASLLSSHVRNFTVSFEEAKGATYASSILPIVNDCSRDDAGVIFSNLGLGQANATVDTLAVKDAFEKNYACMGVTCKDIGGVWEGSYYGQYSFPCNHQVESDTSSTLILVAVILGFVLIPCLLLGVFLCCWRKSCATNKEPIYEDSYEAEIAADNRMATINLD